MPRPLGPFIESPGGYGRRPRAVQWIMMLVLLVVVLFVVFKIIPQNDGSYSDRQARKKLVEAQKLEEDSLHYYASEIYARIVDSNRVSNEVRFDAARGLARTSRIAGRDEAVEAALEKAIVFSKAGVERDAVRDELAGLRGHPLAAAQSGGTSSTQLAAAMAAPDSDAVPAGDAVDPFPLPPDARILARISGKPVGSEEILYAWGQFNGMRDPSAEEFKPFVKMYLDIVLLAEEAHRRGLDRQPNAVYDLRLQHILGLNRALTDRLIYELKSPDAKELEAFYNKNKALFAKPAQAVIGHIVVASESKADSVRKALRDGQDFDAVARKYSLDADRLKEGYILGTISANDPGIPGFGPDPRLIGRLMAMKSDATTGPIVTSRGMHWIRILEKTPAVSRAFKDVQEEVLFSYQKQALAQTKQRLLDKLRQERPIQIEDPGLRAEMSTDAATSATTVTATGLSLAAMDGANATSTPLPRLASTTETLALSPTPVPTQQPRPTPESSKTSGRTKSKSSDKKAKSERNRDGS